MGTWQVLNICEIKKMEQRSHGVTHEFLAGMVYLSRDNFSFFHLTKHYI